MGSIPDLTKLKAMKLVIATFASPDNVSLWSGMSTWELLVHYHYKNSAQHSKQAVSSYHQKVTCSPTDVAEKALH